MIYIVSGKESYLIDEKLNELISKNGGEVIKIDGLSKNFSYEEVLESCTSVGLFSNASIVLVKDPVFLKNKVEDKGLDRLVEYCKSPVYENDLVFYTYDDNFKKTLKVYKDISSNANVISLSIDPKNFYSYCASMCKEAKLSLDKSVLNELVNICNNSLTLFKQNIEILKLYPDKIDLDVMYSLCTSSDEENVFDLINALTTKKISESTRLVNRILANDNNINGLIALLASQLRFLYEVSYYDSIGDNIDTIAYKTSSKPYRIKLCLDKLGYLKRKDIMPLLNRLCQLDIKTKSNNDIADKLKLELFISSMIV